MEEVSKIKSFEGYWKRYKHASENCACDMHFSVFLPPQYQDSSESLPVLYWLSGLTCTDENFVIKSGAQQYAAKHGLVLVVSDTSPRGETVHDTPADVWDLGSGAGFYVDASESPWSNNYKMYSYITQELPTLIEEQFNVNKERRSIFGHSMGGHGALTIALKNSKRYLSVSAFAPIVSPIAAPWGNKAFKTYLGENPDVWAQHDSVELIKAKTFDKVVPMKVCQGGGDEFLAQLQPELLVNACEQANYPLDYQLRDDYDHSYYFIASFIEEHIDFHAKYLKG